MKLIKKLALFVLLLFINLTIVNAEVTVDQIVSGLNNNIKSINVTYDTNSINIDATEMLDGFTCEFELNGNIIAHTYDPMNNDSLYKHTFFTYIINEISKLYDYEEYELFFTINSKQSDSYTLEKNGFKKEKSGYVTSYKIDYTKKIPLVDYSNTYIKETDIAEHTKYYQDGSVFSFNTIVENQFLWVNTDDSNLEVIIGETKGVTQNSYKSLMTVLSIIFRNKKINSYFEGNIKELNKDLRIDGVEIYIDDEQVKNNYSQYEAFKNMGFDFTYIKINKEVLKNAAESYVPTTEDKKEEKEENEPTEEKEEQEQQEENTPVYPKTMDPKILIIPAVAVALISILIIVAYLKNEKKKEQLITNPPVEQPVQQPVITQQPVAPVQTAPAQPVDQLIPVQPIVQEQFPQPVTPVEPVQNFEQPPQNNSGNNL